MKLKTPAALRPALAAAVMLAVLAGAYETARRLPPPAATQPPTALAHQTMATDSAMVGQSYTETTTLSTDTVARVGPDAAPPPSPTPAPEPPPCPDQPIRFVPVDPAERQPLSLHRYVGGVGGQPATALLQWRTLAEVSGSFYLHRSGATYTLNTPVERKNQPVLQVDTPGGFGSGGQNEWHLTGWPGLVLRGTWHDSAGNHPFYLRESYAGAVRADVQTLRLEGGNVKREPHLAGCHAGSCTYSYLQFLAPWAVAPALRRTLGPPPAIMRRRLRALYEDGTEQRHALTEFLLNDFNLLSYQVKRSRAELGNDGKGDDWAEYYLFDLTTGRELTIASQLRPGYETLLRRLIQRHLLHDSEFDFINKDHRATWNWQDATGQATQLVALPEINRADDNGHATGLVLTASGLDAVYSSAQLYDIASEDDYFYLSNSEYSASISYAELRPLVRPGTPLARMLRARGM